MNQKTKPLPHETNQIKQLNFKVSPDFYWRLKNFASSKRLKMGEVLEKAFKFYEKREAIINELNTYRQTISSYWTTNAIFSRQNELIRIEIEN